MGGYVLMPVALPSFAAASCSGPKGTSGGLPAGRVEAPSASHAQTPSSGVPPHPLRLSWCLLGTPQPSVPCNVRKEMSPSQGSPE